MRPLPALICKGACAGPTFLNHHLCSLLFSIPIPRPLPPSFLRQGILSLSLRAECHSLRCVATPSHRPLVSKVPIVLRPLSTSSDFHLHTPSRVPSSQILLTTSTTEITQPTQRGSPLGTTSVSVLFGTFAYNKYSCHFSTPPPPHPTLTAPKHKSSIMSPDKPSPAAAKQRIMGDLKQVSSEKWVRVDVRGSMIPQSAMAHS